MTEQQPALPGYDCHRLPPLPYENRLTVADIQEQVARFFRIPLIEMKSARRSREVARPRQIAMYLAKKLTTQSLPEIGRRFGGRDHTTVIHAIKRVESLCTSDEEVSRNVRFLVREIEG